MPVVVAGVAAYAGAAAAGYTVATAVAIGVAAAVGTYALTEAMKPDIGLSMTDPAQDQSLQTQSNMARKIIYGTALAGAQIVGYAQPTIAQKDYHIMVLNIAGHPCESVELYEIEGKTPAELAGKYQLTFYTGDQTAADPTAKMYVDGWTSDHVGYGQTYAVLKLEIDGELFPGAINEIKFKVKGKKVYDPRKDSTAGGSGTHRINDKTTWEWSDNPQLCAYNWVMEYGGKMPPLRRIPTDFMAITANYCDELATYTDKDGNQQQDTRFSCNGILNNSVKPAEGLKQIMATCGAKVYRVGGRIFIKPAMYAGPASVTVDISEVHTQPTYQPHRAYRDLLNTVRTEYVEPELKWQVTNAPVVDSPAYIARDKSILEETFRYTMVTKDHQAQRLGKLKLERSRAGFLVNKILPGIRLDIVAGNNINFIDSKTGISREFLVEDVKYDAANRKTTAVVVEEGPQLYPDSFEPAEGELTPNTTLPDTTIPYAPESVAFSETPSDSWRQGVITWTHPSPDSIVNYIVHVTNGSGYEQTFTPAALEQSLSNIAIGTYTVTVSAKNRFGKKTAAAPIQIAVNSSATPSGVTTQVLTGKVIVTGPPLPHDGATYDWRYAFDGVWGSSYDGGRNVSLTITNTPQGGTVTVWYRLIDGERADPNWTSFQIGGLLSETIYTWIRYADDEQGNGISADPTNKQYIGFAYNKPVPTPSETPADYTWGLMTAQGIPGDPGADGVTTYTWIRYADNAAGTIGFSNTPLGTTQYIGIAHNKTTATESTDPEDYVWAHFKGDPGPQGVAGAPGADGQTTYTWIKYADNASGGGLSNDPTGKAYIGFAYNKNTPSESSNAADYTWAKVKGDQGDTGVAGAPGADGQTTYTWIKYSANADGTGLTDDPQSNTAYIGIAVNKLVAAESSNKADYVWSKWKGDQGPQGVPGAPGADGQTTYTWIKYADDASGTGLSNDPSGKEFIGFAYNKTTQTESTSPGDYVWSRMTGQGVPGAPGADGQTTYTWIKYAASSDGTSGFNDAPQSNTTHIGIAVNKTTASESTNPADYVWSRFKGDTGPQGNTGAKGDTGSPGADGQDGVAAPNITPTRGLVWQFRYSNNNGWVPYNANFSYGVDTFIIDATSSDPYIVRNSIGPFSGRDSYAIVVKLRCTTADLNTTASMYFMRSGDSGYDGSRVKNISARYKQDEYTYLVFDMRNVNAYISANITGLRFDPAGANQTFEIDQIWIGYTGAADETDYEDSRISNDALQAGTVLYYNDLRSASVSWSSGSQNSGGNAYSVSSGYAGDAFVHILSADSEGGHFISMNGIQNGNGLAGADNELRWYTRKVNVSAGTNTLRLYALSADGGSFYAVVVTNTQIFDPEAFLSSRDAYLNNRIGAVRPDNAYKNSNTTPFDVGLENVDNVSQATILNNAYNQAITSVLLRNPDGTGINFVHPAYFNPLPEIPLGSAANLYGSLTAGNPRQFPGELPAGINRVFRLSPTTSDGYLYLGRSSTDYNLSIIPNRRWLVTAYTLRWNGTGSGLGVPHIQIYLKINNGSGSHRSTGNAVATGALREWRRQVIGVIDCTGDSATEAVLRVDCDSAPGSEMWVAGIMLEPVDTASNPTPSPYSAPLGTAPILSNGYLPMNTNAGQSTQSIQPLATSKYNNAARITINAHTLYVGDLSISYSTGHIDGLAYSTVYYIYCDDPYSQGGTPPGGYKYVDAASYQDLSKSSGRYWIGAKKTVSSGGTTPPPDDDFNCVAEDMYLVAGLQAKDCQTGDILDAWNPDCGFVKKAVKHRPTATAMCIAIRTESGAYTEVSFTTPIDLEDGRTIIAANAEGEKLLALKEDGSFCWERVVSAQLIGEKTVVKINCGDVSYASGSDVTNRIVTHNAVFKP